jgi:tetratricopeptide (TPR) repeat protein
LAVNKRKVLDAARKYAQKGAKEKALKEYHRLLKLDPRDAKLHLEIGDCYRRWGQIDEAITQYARVADQYKEDGFDARAVAVFKQILNLDPKRYSAHVSLSEIYQRMGLDSEALAALQAAADGYHKEGNKRDALELLRKMATLDPTNTTSRLKVAELLRQEEMEDDAVSEYEAVIAELERQGATESILAVQERVIELRPDRADILIGIARRLIELGKPERAEPFARQAVAKDPEETDAQEVLCDIYKALGNEDELAKSTRALAKIYRDRGDSDKARELAQRVPLSLEMDSEAAPASTSASGVDQSESAFLSDDELLDDDFLASDSSETKDVSKAKDVSEELPLGDGDELELELDDDSDDDGALDLGLDDETLLDDASDDELSDDDSDEPALEGDPDQLLAEASVYLRYGKRTQAIASLKAVLDQEPENRAALEKLGDAYADGDDDAKAVEMWGQASQRARAEGDAEGFAVLRDRVAALDTDAAEALGEMSPSSATEETGIDFEVEVDDGAEAPTPTFEADISETIEVDAEPGEDESESFEIDIDEDAFGEEDAAANEAAPAGDEGIEFDMDAGSSGPDERVPSLTEAEPAAAEEEEDFELDIDVDVDVEEDNDAAADESSSAAPSSSSTGSQQVSEDLEEAEFYFQQELFDEAEGVYRRILKVAPNHPSALLRLGELAAARGGDPGEVSADESFEAKSPEKKTKKTPKKTAKKAEKKVQEKAETARVEAPEEVEEPAPELEEEPLAVEVPDEVADSLDIDLGVDEDPAAGEDSTEVAELSAGEVGDEPAVQMDLPQAPHEAAAAAASRADDTVPFENEVDPQELEVEESESEEADEPEEEPAIDLASDDPAEAEQEAEEAEEGGFDLAAELRDVLEEDEDPNGESADGSLSTVEDGFESIFADFKQGVSQTLSEDDYETRYDLGIAYREMELYDDAIGEFRLCLESSSHKLASLHMMGLCAMDLDRVDDATNHLEQALSTPDLPPEQLAGLNFDLGRALEMAGQLDRARAAYYAVLDADPAFPGVAERIEALAGGGEAPPAASSDDEGFESFDDLMAEAEAEAEDEDDTTEEAESFESFDDVITEAEAIIDAEPVDAEPADVLEEVPEVSEEPPAAPTKKKRKKKISFV